MILLKVVLRLHLEWYCQNIGFPACLFHQDSSQAFTDSTHLFTVVACFCAYAQERYAGNQSVWFALNGNGQSGGSWPQLRVFIWKDPNCILQHPSFPSGEQACGTSGESLQGGAGKGVFFMKSCLSLRHRDVQGKQISSVGWGVGKPFD